MSASYINQDDSWLLFRLLLQHIEFQAHLASLGLGAWERHLLMDTNAVMSYRTGTISLLPPSHLRFLHGISAVEPRMV